MTNWSELDDLGLSETHDDFDPLAPMVDCGELAFAEDKDDDLFVGRRESLLDEDGNFNLELGFSDGSGVVRVWVDEDKRMTKVRLAPSWREKLVKGPSKDPAMALEMAFGVTFMAINNKDFGKTQPTVSMVDKLPPAKDPLTVEDWGRANARIIELLNKVNAIPEGQGGGTWQGDKTVGHSRDRKVQVDINLHGSYSYVHFDRAWLEDSRVSQVCEGVMQAAADAWAKFVPGRYEKGERELLIAEVTAIQSEMSAKLRKGFLA